MRRDLKRFAMVLLTIATTSLLCITLYMFNNKYTYRNLQPQEGILTVSESDMDQVHYLIHDWIFYPDVLLTSEELKERGQEYTSVYTDIGALTRFDGLGTRTTPHGCGTYVLKLILPEPEDSYALELPEIYSAYRLFINGEEYTQVGNPDPEEYLDRTQSKTVTFRTGGQAEILIAVSDYSHFYSGMVYPPLFGRPSQIIWMRDIRNTVTLISVALGLILMIPTLWLGVAMRRNNAILFSLLSFIMCTTILFPFLHTLFELPVKPWYTLELVSIYVMPLLIILIHNRICDVARIYQYISVGIAFLVCCIACGYGLSAQTLLVPTMRMFSVLVFWYKLFIAGYLLITSFYAMHSDDKQVPPLYYASISYAVIFLWDRILPDYEPIIYGWFSDWGNLILVIAIGFSLIRDMIAAYVRSLSFAEEQRQMTRQLVMQKEYSRQISKDNEEKRKIIHDFRQQIRTISVLTEQMQATEESKCIQDELQSYLKKITDHTFVTKISSHKPFSSNPTIDALLQYYYSYTKKMEIDSDFHLSASQPDLTEVEYCTVLGNLLENAVDACVLLPKDTARKIRLYSYETEHLLFIKIENTYDGIVLQENHHFLSRKQKNHLHGIGIDSVQDIILRHGGTMDIYPMETLFRVGISIPLK